jgi:hypothetical protein
MFSKLYAAEIRMPRSVPLCRNGAEPSLYAAATCVLYSALPLHDGALRLICER